MLRIGIKTPRTIAVLIHGLAVGNALSGQYPCQRFFDLRKRSGISEKPLQRLFGPLQYASHGRLGFEDRAGLGDQLFDRMVCWIHIPTP
jgi:hypothetical protein